MSKIYSYPLIRRSMKPFNNFLRISDEIYLFFFEGDGNVFKNLTFPVTSRANYMCVRSGKKSKHIEDIFYSSKNHKLFK